MFVWWWLWNADMFPHLLHTKNFLDWRFGRQEGEDADCTGAGAASSADVCAGASAGSWLMSRGRRSGRLLVRSRRHKITTSTVKLSNLKSSSLKSPTVKSSSVKSLTVKFGHRRSARRRTTLHERRRRS